MGELPDLLMLHPTGIIALWVCSHSNVDMGYNILVQTYYNKDCSEMFCSVQAIIVTVKF